MTLDEFHALPVVMTFFPLTFGSGKQKWTQFQVHCNDCDRVIPKDQTRGTVELAPWGNYRLMSTRYEVIAHGLCPGCNRLTTAHYILHEDMTLTGIHPKTGEMARWGMRKLTWWEKVVDWFKTKFGKDES